MKRTEYLKELRALSDGSLDDRCRSLAEESMRLRFKHATGQVADSGSLGRTRRNLARALTETTRRSRERRAGDAPAGGTGR